MAVEIVGKKYSIKGEIVLVNTRLEDDEGTEVFIMASSPRRGLLTVMNFGTFGRWLVSGDQVGVEEGKNLEETVPILKDKGTLEANTILFVRGEGEAKLAVSIAE